MPNRSRTLPLLLWGVPLLLSAFIAGPVSAGPITFNTALPVTRGEGILRVQSKFLRSTDDPGLLNRELRVRTVPVVGVYGASRRLALFSIIPFLDKELEADTPAGRRTRSVTGLGDVTLIARYTARQWDSPGRTIRIAPFIGIEVPTGKHHEKDRLGTLPRTLQLGSGSWDPSAGITWTRQGLKWEADAAVSYKFNTQAHGFAFGDEARLDLSFQKRVYPRKLGGGVPGFLYVVLESNLVRRGENRVDGARDRDSGGTAWFLTPGVQYVTRRIVVETAVQLPVVQNLNGDALENDFTATVSVRVNF